MNSVKDLSSRVRIGINFGNALLAGRDAAGAPTGIAVDLARELCSQLGLTADIVPYESAGPMADAAKADAWDVAFLAADPGRADAIAFTAPYLEIEATYLVPRESSIREMTDVDREGVRIAVSENSAYDLFLRRSIRHAQLVPAPGVDASVSLFFDTRLDALAGLRPLLADVTSKRPDCRVLDGRFTAVQQAIGTPLGRDRAYLDDFVAAVTSSGFVARTIARHGMQTLLTPV